MDLLAIVLLCRSVVVRCSNWLFHAFGAPHKVEELKLCVKYLSLKLQCCTKDTRDLVPFYFELWTLNFALRTAFFLILAIWIIMCSHQQDAIERCSPTSSKETFLGEHNQSFNRVFTGLCLRRQNIAKLIACNQLRLQLLVLFWTYGARTYIHVYNFCYSRSLDGIPPDAAVLLPRTRLWVFRHRSISAEIYIYRQDNTKTVCLSNCDLFSQVVLSSKQLHFCSQTSSHKPFSLTT